MTPLFCIKHDEIFSVYFKLFSDSHLTYQLLFHKFLLLQNQTTPIQQSQNGQDYHLRICLLSLLLSLLQVPVDIEGNAIFLIPYSKASFIE